MKIHWSVEAKQDRRDLNLRAHKLQYLSNRAYIAEVASRFAIVIVPFLHYRADDATMRFAAPGMSACVLRRFEDE